MGDDHDARASMLTPHAAAYFDDLFVGVIGCRPEMRPDGKQRLYVAVLAVLAPYRGLGVGSRLMTSVLDELPKHPEVVEVYLHVHTPNTRAIAFYERLGFDNVGVIHGYYPDLDPTTCVLLRRLVSPDVTPSVTLERGGAGAPLPPTPAAGAPA